MSVRKTTCAALILATAFAVAAGAAPSSRPHIELTGTQPLSVRGAGFHARERVTVLLHQAEGATRAHHVTTSRAGSFTATFLGALLGRCAGVSITAVGAAGDRAMLKRIPLPACHPV